MQVRSLFLASALFLPSALWAQGFVAKVTPAASAAREALVSFRADAASRLFDPDHTSHARFTAMLELAKASNLKFEGQTSFDIDEVLYKVTAQVGSRRVFRPNHPYLTFWNSLKQHGQALVDLQSQGDLTLDKVGLTADDELPALELNFAGSVSGAQLGVLSSRALLCSLPVIGRHRVPSHLLDAIDRRGLCDDALSLDMLQTMKNVAFKTSNSLLKDVDTTGDHPSRQNVSLSFFTELCALSIDPELARVPLQSFVAQGWIPADYDQGNGTQDATRACRLHVMTRVLPELTTAYNRYLVDYTKESIHQSEFLRRFITESTQEETSAVVASSKELVSFLQAQIFPSLVNAEYQSIPFFQPFRDFNITEAKKVIAQTRGIWSSADRIKEALFVAPVNRISPFFQYLKTLDPIRRNALTQTLGDLYLSQCSSSEPISVACINSSSVAIETVELRGLSLDPDSVAIDFASLRF